MLACEFADLMAAGYNVELTGFTAEELAALVPEEIPAGLTDEDAVPEVPIEPVTKLGDVWLLGVYYECQDCGKKYTQEEGDQMKACPCVVKHG